MNKKFRLSSYYFILVILRLASLMTFLVIVLAISGLVLPLFDDLSKYDWAVKVFMFNMSMRAAVESVMPTVIKGFSITNFLIILVAFFLKLSFDYFATEQVSKIYYLQHLFVDRRLPESDKKKVRSSMIFVKIYTFLKNHALYRRSKLRKLQKKFNDLKIQLDKFGQDLVFLSIDIVKSADMKRGVDQATVEHYFGLYKEYVRDILKKNEVMKESWTPDGVMACFRSFVRAFYSAQEIVKGLPAFNSNNIHFKYEFRVRCGINGGFILFDEALELQELANREIDIAGHVQKEASPNTIFVTRKTIEPKRLVSQLKPSLDLVDDQQVFVWSPAMEEKVF